MIVLDASIAVKLVVREPGSDDVFARVVNEADRVAPDLCQLEVAAALSKKVRYHGLDPRAAIRALDQLHYIVTGTYDTAALIEPGFRLSIEIGHAIQDCLYLALAREHGCSLLTADVNFAKAAARRGFGEQVELVTAG